MSEFQENDFIASASYKDSSGQIGSGKHAVQKLRHQGEIALVKSNFFLCKNRSLTYDKTT